MINNPTKRLCPPDGPKDAKVAYIGEAPGSTEEKLGRGFVGPSGDLLFQISQNVGMFRTGVYCTNVVKERPKDNDISTFITFKAGRALPTELYNLYEKDLYEELKEVKANVLVAVGGVALWALCRRTAITKLRGSILEGVEAIGGRKVIPIIHPAAALRQYLYTHTIAMDLRRVKEESEFPEVRLPIRHYVLRPSFLDTMAFLTKCSEEKMIAFDIEVMREEVSCISFAYNPYEVISIPFTEHGSADYFPVDQEMKVWRMIGSILDNPEITKIGQNIVFDSTFLFQRFGIRTRNLEDTMIGQAIMYPDFPKGLDFITAMHTKEPYYKDEGKKWFKMGGSEEDFWLYNAKDSAVCIEAFPKIMSDLDQIDNREAYLHQRSLVEPLTYIQIRGIRTNAKGMKEESEKVDKEINALKERLNKIVGYDLNPGSPKQIQDYFYNVKKEKPYLDRKTHQPTADKNAIKRLIRKGYEEAKILQEISKKAYLKSHYLDVTLDKDGRLRCSFNPVGTKSGRLSSSETIFDTGTNMQNLPEVFRKFLIADDDCLIFNVDLSQAENRIVAYVAPEPNMIKAFEEKIDIHSQTASLISGIPIDEVRRQDKSDPQIMCETLGGGEYTWRFWGKKANHGLNYDLGYRAFSFLYELDEAEGRYIVEKYHNAYPGVRMYHAWIKNQLGKNRTLENLFGRKYLYLDRWGDDLFKAAYSFIPQSSVADIINRRGLNFMYYDQERFAPIDLLLQVHDSIAFQINFRKYSWEEQARCLMLLRDSLQTPLTWRGTSFSIPADISVGTSFSKSDMMEVKGEDTTSVERLARRLYAIYEKFRAA